MTTTRTAILQNARIAGETAAAIEYDALTPETARALRSDVVPDYAGEAARIEAASVLGIADPSDLRGTRIERAATEAWARAFRAAWPAEDVAALAAIGIAD
jgi:hypothetical protein